MPIYEKPFEDLPSINQNFTLITPANQQWRHNLSEHEYSESEYLEDKAKYTYANLNQGQKGLYDAVFENPTAINVIQAGPGTGKTFTLLSIAHNWPNPSHVVISNRNLLYQFRYCSLRYTTAKFFMTMLDINFKDYKELNYYLNGKMSNLQFVMAIVNILSKATLPPLGKGLLILDEYIVLPKPLLLVTLLLCSHAKIGVILCGDKNRLQNMHNSPHMGQYSSLDIASAFTDRIHTLVRNERCSDTQYNEIVRYVSRFSSDHEVDDFMRAIITAVFPKQVLGVMKFNSVHLATSNKQLMDCAKYCASIEGCAISYYMDYMDVRRDKINFDSMKKFYMKKFEPYLPLSIGGRYYVPNISDRIIAELKRINYNPESSTIESLVLESEGGTTIPVERNLILPEEHSDDCDYLYNFPLYPADFMTLHKCQGCTISRPIDAHLDHFYCKYRGVYVVMSCCTSSQCIDTVNINNKYPHLLSYIINFPESLDPAFTMTANVLEDRMQNYYMCEPIDNWSSEELVQAYFRSESREERIRIRGRLLELNCRKNLLPLPDTMTHQENDTLTIIKFLKYIKLFLPAACIPPQDLGLWLMELCRVTPSFASLLLKGTSICSGYMYDNVPELYENSYLARYANLIYISDTMQPAVKFIKEKLATQRATKYQTEVLFTNSTSVGDCSVMYVSKFQKIIYDLNNDVGPSSVTTEMLFDWLNMWVSTYGQRQNMQEI